jgi:adenylate cyclase
MNKILTNQWFHVALLTGALIFAVVLSFSDTRWREQIRNFTFDNYNIAKPRQNSDSIVIVDIDEASLREIGQMPWPRTVMADMVRALRAMGAKVIAFDIVFAEEDRSSPWAVAKAFQDRPGFEDLGARFGALADNDALFGVAIGEAGNVVTGFSFTNELTDTVPAQKGIFRGKNIEKFVPRLAGASSNLKTINRFAAGNGSFFVSTDTDGIIRRVPMLVAHDRGNSEITSVYPSLALETIRVLDGEKGGKVILENSKYAALDPGRFGIEGIEIGYEKRFIPTNAHGEFLLYFARSNPDWYVPAHTVLDRTISPEVIKDKIVLIGTSAVGLKDIRSTPLDTFVSGVEVHLNIIDQILQGQYLNRAIEAEGLEAVVIVLTGLFIIVFAPFVGAAAQALVVSAVAGMLVYAGWYAFDHFGMLIDVTYPLISVLAIFMLSTMLTYLRIEREKRQVRQAFGLYISPDFMRELTKDPDKLKLGGEARDLSVMFTDIRGFTSLAEQLNPQELIQLMNDFLTPMSDLVMANRGTIDKYMGDAMMAFWNAPLEDEQHARHACMAALGMQAALAPINDALRNRARQGPPLFLQAGIGINTGPCAVGNMGSRQRFAYSALGDTVNLASRLEGQTKTYGVDILIGEATRNHVLDFAILEIDLIRVKGKTQPVHIFALIGPPAMAADAAFAVWNKKHEAMIMAYRAGDFEAARALAEECRTLDISNLDPVYDLYIQRCETLIENPPARDWDGVFEARTK